MDLLVLLVMVNEGCFPYGGTGSGGGVYLNYKGEIKELLVV